MHSVMNSIYAKGALPMKLKINNGFKLFELLSNENSKIYRKK